jgi:hypothetical protein
MGEEGNQSVGGVEPVRVSACGVLGAHSSSLVVRKETSQSAVLVMSVSNVSQPACCQSVSQKVGVPEWYGGKPVRSPILLRAAK